MGLEQAMRTLDQMHTDATEIKISTGAGYDHGDREIASLVADLCLHLKDISAIVDDIVSVDLDRSKIDMAPAYKRLRKMVESAKSDSKTGDDHIVRGNYHAGDYAGDDAIADGEILYRDSLRKNKLSSDPTGFALSDEEGFTFEVDAYQYVGKRKFCIRGGTAKPV